MFIAKEVKELWQAIIDTYQDWETDDYYFYNNKLWYKIKAATWVMYLEMRGNDLWGIFEKHYIKRCINKAIAKKISHSITK